MFAIRLGVGLAVVTLPSIAAGAPPARQAADTLGVIRGKVLDSASAPIDGAEILLIDLALSGYSNRSGRFTIPLVPSGTHQLVARMVGFGAVGARATVAAGDTVELLFTMPHSATVLPDVTVESREGTTSPKLRPFEERRRTGLGHFYTRSEIEAHEHQTIATLLRVVPRVEVVQRDGAIALAAQSAGTMKLPRYRRWPSKCYLQVYLDGILTWRQNNGEDAPYDLS